MTNDQPLPDRNLLSGWTPWIVVLVLIAVAAGGYAVYRESGKDRKSAGLSDALTYDVEKYRLIPPEQIGYEQTGMIPTDLRAATALCVGPADEIVVGGDRQVLVLAADGEIRASIDTGDVPRALAASKDGRIYVAFWNWVERGPLDGPLVKLFQIPGDKARITSIAVDRRTVYVADAGSRAVLYYSLEGKPLGRIGDKDRDRNIPGFNVPSPYFDLLMAPDGLLRIVDPGRHRVTAFTTDGDLEFSWGRPSFKVAGFNGCCNPSHIAMLGSGRVVTSEKGIPRVKVYDVGGSFVTGVVDISGLTTDTDPCEVATDSRGRILVLDPGARAVRIFEVKERPDRER